MPRCTACDTHLTHSLLHTLTACYALHTHEHGKPHSILYIYTPTACHTLTHAHTYTCIRLQNAMYINTHSLTHSFTRCQDAQHVTYAVCSTHTVDIRHTAYMHTYITSYTHSCIMLHTHTHTHTQYATHTHACTQYYTLHANALFQSML